MNPIPAGKFERFPLVFGVLTVFVIFLLAAISVLGSRNLQGVQTKQKPSTNAVNKGKVNSPPQATAHFLNVDQPEDNFVAQTPSLAVKGKTSALATVVAVAGEETQLTEADAGGNFSLNLPLQEGTTEIEITAFTQNGEEQSVTREVFYTPEAI